MSYSAEQNITMMLFVIRNALFFYDSKQLIKNLWSEMKIYAPIKIMSLMSRFVNGVENGRFLGKHRL